MPRPHRPRTSTASSRPSGLAARAGKIPSKAEIRSFVDSAPGRVGRREIARAFGLGIAERNALKKLWREIKAERISKPGGCTTARSNGLPPVGLATVSDVDDDGAISVTPHHDDGAAGSFALRGLKQESISIALGLGDRVLVRFITPGGGEGHAGERHARLIRHLGRNTRRITGIVSGPMGGPYWLESVSKRKRDDVALDPAGTPVSVGDLVSAEIDGEKRRGAARLITIHGPAAAVSQTSLIAVHEYEIRHEFPQAVVEEAAAAQAPSPAGRTDLSHVPFITIDPEDARDHDDAVHAMPDPDAGNPDGWIIQVAIADVAHFVRPGSALDREARKRGNSVYFPDRVVPMLPEALSTDLCSLKLGVERAAFVARMVFDASGAMRHHSFERAIIVSRANLTYVDAQQAIDGAADANSGEFLDQALRPLWAAYAVLSHGRERRDPLALVLPERRILFDESGEPCDVITPPRLDSHCLIEEFMIQANVAIAETLENRKVAFLRRVHDAPATEKVDALGEYLRSLDLKLARVQSLTTSHFNHLIAQAESTPHGDAVAQAVLRAQSQAVYGARDRGHFGLNLRRYAHFTSPIRRYADIIAHRALISQMALGPDGNDRETIAALDEIGAQISEAERRAMAAERDTADRLITRLLAKRVGAIFSGRIAGMVRSGLFVELDETGASGFVAAAALGRKHGDYFTADEATFSLRGRESGSGYRIGERVEVRLTDAEPMSGSLDFEMLTLPRKLASSRRRCADRPIRRGRREQAR